MPRGPDYLQPYLDAARRHGAGFGSLLWNSPHSQAIRFDAITRIIDLRGARVLDVGCGRGDLLEFLVGRDLWPGHYTGIEAVPALVEAARGKSLPNSRIVRGDFIAHPRLLRTGADVVVCCGSLNTLAQGVFEQVVQNAFAGARRALVFNFLSSSRLAGARHLVWHEPAEVIAMLGKYTDRLRRLEDYLDGDCTVVAEKG